MPLWRELEKEYNVTIQVEGGGRTSRFRRRRVTLREEGKTRRSIKQISSIISLLPFGWWFGKVLDEGGEMGAKKTKRQRQ